MRALVNGAGRMGRAVAFDLVERADSEVILNDADAAKLSAAREFLGDDAVDTVSLDVTDSELTAFLERENPDIVVNALPHELSVPAIDRAIAAGVDTIDLAFEEEQYELAAKAAEHDVTVVPGCGVAPGLSNMLAGDGITRVEDPESVSIKVGGLPADPSPPLEYRVVFHLDSVWNAYTRPARIRTDGTEMEVPSLSGVEPVHFDGVGELECFYTDGLGTLLDSFETVPNMEEKTIRYPDHATKARALRECGLLDPTPVEFGDASISPREFLTELLTPDLYLGDERDLTVMRVDVTGAGGDTYEATVIDHYDEETGLTSMARTTGFTAAIVAAGIVNGDVEQNGLVPPEEIAVDPTWLDSVVDQLTERGVTIRRDTRS